MIEKCKLLVFMGCCIFLAATGLSAVTYSRNTGGNWNDSSGVWKASGTYVSEIPNGAENNVTLISENIEVDLSDCEVTVNALTIGAYDASSSKSATLNVQKNLNVMYAVQIGSSSQNSGNGALIVSNATVSAIGTTSVGKTAEGQLTLNDGAVYSNSTWRVDVGSKGNVTLNNSLMTMVNGLIMENGGRINLNGDSELWIMGNDQSRRGSPLRNYIGKGWIFGNGTSGNVQAQYDGEKTVVYVFNKEPPKVEQRWPFTLAVNFSPSEELYGPTARRYQGIPSIERSSGGRLWVTFTAGKLHEDQYRYIVTTYSDDDGKTWLDRSFVADPDGDGPTATLDSSLWVDPNGHLWNFWFLGGTGELVGMKTDNPDSAVPEWTEPVVIGRGDLLNEPIAISDGTWLLPTARWMQDESVVVYASEDEGETWEERGAASVPNPKDRSCDEPMIVEKKNGSLWLLVRTSYGIGQSYSYDKGKTWTPVSPSEIAHPISRFHICRLRSGNLLLVKHGGLNQRYDTAASRTWRNRSHLTALISKDDGNSWEGGLLLDERVHASYPDVAESPDGTIYCVYDWKRTDEKNLLMAVFTEEDVLAGRFVSKQGRAQVLVNHATGVNPKPWLYDGGKLGLMDNQSGKPFISGLMADLSSTKEDEKILPVKGGQPVFKDRSYRFVYQLPDFLVGKRYLQSDMETAEVLCKKGGIAYVLAVNPSRNKKLSAATDLVSQGFELVAIPETIIFPDSNGDLLNKNACSVYRKKLETDEKISFGAWGVVITE